MKEAIIAGVVLALLVLVGACAEPFGFTALEREEGEIVPWFMGVAWRDLLTSRQILMPVPINIVAGLVRRGWYALRAYGLHDPISQAMQNAYWRGYEKGHEAGVAKAEREFARHFRMLARPFSWVHTDVN